MSKREFTNPDLSVIYDELRKDDVKVEDKYKYYHTKKTSRTIELSLGRIWFNTILPDDYPLVNEVVNNDKINDIFYDISKKYSAKEASEYLTNIQKEAYIMATINVKTFRIDAFTPSEQWKDKKKEFLDNSDKYSNNEYIKKAEEITDLLMTELADKKVGAQDGIAAGVSGKFSKETWKTLSVTKGLTVDMEGNVYRINNSIEDGYSIENYYKAAAEGRRGHFIKSSAVADPGYLARKITMSNAGITITEEDCKTKQYYVLKVDKDISSKMVGRYYIDDANKLKLVETPSEIVGKTLKFRSPLYCKTQNGLCSTCYGKLSELTQTKNVGVLAGGAINNVAVNLMMKKRHSGTQVKLIDVNFKKILDGSQIDEKIIKKYLDVQNTDIYAKEDILIILDTDDYHDSMITELGNSFKIPGIIELFLGENEEATSITLPFNFNIELYKPQDIIKDGHVYRLLYHSGEKIIHQTSYVKDVDPPLLTRLFDGVTKHIQKPELLVEFMYDQLGKIDLVHLELVVGNMFRSKIDNKIPGRLVNYKNCVIIGCKQLPFVDSFLSALAFENINKAIRIGLVKNEDAVLNPVERILIEKGYGEEQMENHPI